MIIRAIKATDHQLLEKFLYLAVHQQDPENPIPPSVVNIPEVRNYIANFGKQKHDYGLVAVKNDNVVGMAWARVLSGKIKGYGYIDDQTPELAISVEKNLRGQGIGVALMNAIIELLRSNGYQQCSLSVEKTNRATNLYKRLGFSPVKETCHNYIMVKRIA
jgi:ribosomal protein S18 acetylase RimI-like enzyme